MESQPVRYAVIDVETTGFARTDRIVEISIVGLDGDGEIVEEYDTLVNPLGNVGATHIHGITSAMISVAPTFEEIAAAVALRLDGVLLVAHNLPFDGRFLQQEFGRVGARFDRGSGFCTYHLTGAKLDAACRRHRVPLESHHRALADARATAQLLKKLLRRTANGIPAAVTGLRHSLIPRTLRRENAGERGVVCRLARNFSRRFRESSDADELRYLDAVDAAFNDQTLTANEASELRALANEIGLDQAQVEAAHRRYLSMLIAGALRDGIVTETEHRLLRRAADAFGLRDAALPEIT